MLGKLKNGETVTLEDGSVVSYKDCHLKSYINVCVVFLSTFCH